MDDKNIRTFGSVYDLPSVQEIKKQLDAFIVLNKVLRGRFTRELAVQRKTFKEIAYTVDGFYDLLGKRDWIFHDDMNLAALKEIVDTADADLAEKALIRYYQDPETMKVLLLRLRKFSAVLSKPSHTLEQRVQHIQETLEPRLKLVDKAYDDYKAGRYYSVVLVLLAVMDGLVNDIVSQGARKGLHSREPEEMVAWDSVTAHHLGLKHAHESFTKTFRKTDANETHELYRHGIVHGMVTNFDNEIVATKAFNRLFAVVDWAVALKQKETAPEEKPKFSSLIKTAIKDIAAAQRRDAILKNFKPSEHEISEKDNDEFINQVKQFFEAWKAKNYGKLSEFFLDFGNNDKARNQKAGDAKNLYQEFVLENYSLKKVRYEKPLLTFADADVTVNDKRYAISLRWVRSDSNQAGAKDKDITWGLAPCGPTYFITEEVLV